MSEGPVLVTGAGGFIGGTLVGHLRSRGWAVRALVRRIPAERVDGVEYHPYDLAGEPPAGAFAGARFLVHCAFVRHGEDPDSDRVNLEGARALLALCRGNAVKPLFLSSFSAHERAASHYGRSKRQIEGIFDPARDLVLRPGLVVGRGGVFGAILGYVARHRLVPLVGSGSQPQQTLAIGDLCQIVERGLSRDVCGTFSVAHPAATTLRGIYEAVAAHLGRKVSYVPVPMPLLLAACCAAEFLKIPLPVQSDSVLGLKHAQAVDTTRDLAAFGVEARALKESLQALEGPAAGPGSPP